MELLVRFAFMGFLGGLAYGLVRAERWRDLRRFVFYKRLLLGAIIGVLYNFLYSDWDFPNMVMSFVSGYAGVDFIEGLIGRLAQARRPRQGG